MKKLLFLALLGLSTFFVSCDKDDNSSTLISPTTISTTATASGTWRITYYFDSNTDKTSNFSGFNFTFNANGTIAATNNLFNANGTWNASMDDSKPKLFLTFTTPASFTELTEDWHVTALTSTKITMQHISGGGGGTDYLTFEKN
jgi:hypothetical protein